MTTSSILLYLLPILVLYFIINPPTPEAKEAKESQTECLRAGGLQEGGVIWEEQVRGQMQLVKVFL